MQMNSLINRNIIHKHLRVNHLSKKLYIRDQLSLSSNQFKNPKVK